MRKYLVYILVSLFLVFSSGCQQEDNTKNEYNIIPLPNALVPQTGRFVINDKVAINTAGCSPEVKALADSLANRIRQVAGINLPRIEEGTTDISSISFVTQMGMSKESYKLYISPKKVIISATEPNGFFYGIQTFYQLLPAEIYGKNLVPNIDWSVPCVEIEDEPRFEYRGAMLDVSRHFTSVEYIYKFIDLLAIHKMNAFHWHLTDDQGWRIEIMKYPKLTEISSVRSKTLIGQYYDNYPPQFDNKEYKGYYTQEEIKAIVEYASSKFVTIIPEIGIPGHNLAAIAAYPDLCCTPNKKHEVATSWGTFNEIYCPNAITFDFLYGVLDEIIQLFPGPYIHIGGSDIPREAWKSCIHCQALMRQLRLKDDVVPNSTDERIYTKEEKLQRYFTDKIEKYLTAKERIVIGWDEIGTGGVSTNTTVISTHGQKRGEEIAQLGCNIIMAPNEYYKIDSYQEEPRIVPYNASGYTTLRKTYSYNPVPYNADEMTQKHIIGLQGNIWTEYIQDDEQKDYHTFPRLIAIAESSWTKQENKNWAGFCKRLPDDFKVLDIMNVNACESFFDVNIHTRSLNRELKVHLESYYPEGTIYYTTDGTIPSTNSKTYSEPISINKETYIKAAVFSEGKRVGRVAEKVIYGNLIGGKPYTVNPAPNRNKGDIVGFYDYLNTDTITQGLTNGKRGYAKDYFPWVGFQLEYSARELEFIVKLDNPTKIQRIVFGNLHNPAKGILAASGVTVEISDDGNRYLELFKENWINNLYSNGKQNFTHTISFSPVKTSFIKLKIAGGGDIRNGIDSPEIPLRISSYPSSLYIDEIEVY